MMTGTATIHLVEESEATNDVRTIYNEIKQHYNLDFVPNVFKAVARNPQALKQTWEQMKQGEAMWGKETFYLISLAVDVTNGCDY